MPHRVDQPSPTDGSTRATVAFSMGPPIHVHDVAAHEDATAEGVDVHAGPVLAGGEPEVLLSALVDVLRGLMPLRARGHAVPRSGQEPLDPVVTVALGFRAARLDVPLVDERLALAPGTDHGTGQGGRAFAPDGARDRGGALDRGGAIEGGGRSAAGPHRAAGQAGCGRGGDDVVIFGGGRPVGREHHNDGDHGDDGSGGGDVAQGLDRHERGAGQQRGGTEELPEAEPQRCKPAMRRGLLRLPTDLGAGPHQARVDGVDLHAERLGDLRRGHALDVGHHQH